MEINAANTAWMLISTALVILMTPGLAFFYGGLVRSKNVLNTFMMSIASLGVVGVVWVVVGYSFAFGGSNPIFGGFDYFLLNGVDLNSKGGVPHLLFMAFQGSFAIITAALISGAIVERMVFKTYLVFIALWTIFVYAPVCHWVWGDGWLTQLKSGATLLYVNKALHRK
jgi:ammonium transporter, Amt family